MNRPLIYSCKSSTIIGFILLSSVSLALSEQKQVQPPMQSFKQHNEITTDTLPDICSVLPAEEIAALMPFTNPLSKSFPEPDPIENYKACLYQFWNKNGYPAIKISLLKYESKEVALSVYTWNVEGERDLWERDPERIFGLADSAYFGFNAGDTTKCDECALVAIQGIYHIVVAYKGEYDETPRDRKKMIAIKIVQLMYDRIPGLAPSQIRNRQ